MELNLLNNLEACHATIAQAPLNLVFLSHIPTALACLFTGFFAYSKNRNSLVNKALLAIAIAFSTWSFLDTVIWTSPSSEVIMFSWSLLGISSVLFASAFVYFFYVFVHNEDMPFFMKMSMAVLVSPILFFTPTYYNIQSFHVLSCEALEGSLFTNYYYFFGFLAIAFIAIDAFLALRRSESVFRKQILLMAVGAESALLIFFGVGFIVSYFNSLGVLSGYEMELYALFGVPIFLALLAWLIVRYNILHIKILSIQVLVVTLVLLVGSEFFFIKGLLNYLVMSITLLLIIVFGWVFIRSVRSEVRRSEELRIIIEKLQFLDSAKSEFISIASHQLRTPLAIVKGYTSLLMDGDYGMLPDEVRAVLKKMSTSNDRLIHLVEELLSVSRIESGKMQYRFTAWNLEEIARDVMDLLSVRAKEKGLDISFVSSSVAIPEIVLDGDKIREVVTNIIDNALKYTQRGFVQISVSRVDGGVRMIVTDSGVGIDPQEIPYIFEKFSRGQEARRLAIEGTGLGLFIARSIINAHGGRIWAESEGIGHGTRFIIELPSTPPDSQKVINKADVPTAQS